MSFLKALSNKLLLFIKLAYENNSASMLLSLPITGIAIDGGMEEKLGLKSFDEIDALLDELELL